MTSLDTFCQESNAKHRIERKPRKRCKSWNYHCKIPLDEENNEIVISGESVICLSKDGQSLIVSKKF